MVYISVSWNLNLPFAGSHSYSELALTCESTCQALTLSPRVHLVARDFAVGQIPLRLQRAHFECG